MHMNTMAEEKLFDDSKVNLNALKKKAYNGRWAEVDEGKTSNPMNRPKGCPFPSRFPINTQRCL